MKRLRPERVAQIAAAVVLLMLPAEVAAAASSVTSGWWTTAATPTPPDVPSDGLLVQSAVTPTAYAAVSFRLAEDERADSLTLHVVEGSASNPATTLRLCPLTEPIQAEHGGSAADAPRYDCTDPVDAAPDEGTYVFDVSGLAASQTLAVAVLPTGPLDRAVLDGPGVDSLSTVTAPRPSAPASPTNASPPVSAPTATGVVTVTPPAFAPSSPGTVPEAGVDLPSIDESDAAPPTTPVSQETAQPTLPVEPLAGSTTSRLAQLALAATLLAALALWLTSSTLAHGRARRHRHGVSASA